MFQTKLLQNIKIRFMFDNCFFLTLAVYDVTWGNPVQSDRPQVTVAAVKMQEYRHLLTVFTIDTGSLSRG